MTMTEYAVSSVRLREQWAQSSGTTYLLFEIVRTAAAMALVLTLSDLTSLDAFRGDPGTRMKFILLTSIPLAALNLWRARRNRTEVQGSGPPVA